MHLFLFLLFISEPTSSNADCKDAGKQTPAELSEVNDPAFVEPKSGTKPSETIKMRNINTDKLEMKDVKGTVNLVTRKGLKDAPAASSSGQSACESLNKTKLSKKHVPGRGDFCYNKPVISNCTFLVQKKECCAFLVHFGSILGEFGWAKLHVLERYYGQGKIPLARPNKPDVPPKHTKNSTIRLGKVT